MNIYIEGEMMKENNNVALLLANLLEDIRINDIPGKEIIRFVKSDDDGGIDTILKYYLPDEEVNQEDVGKIEHVRLIDLVNELTRITNSN
ncbi:hypothetical protein [Mycoplasma sp. P36-A1]|uniref:hypothetical protein n=1 Tax=Mycoplasma sp. P36-A1 TaxID=3252900 RepID=UPI003C2C9272